MLIINRSFLLHIYKDRYNFTRILFLSYLSIIINLPNTQEKSKLLKESIEYIVSSIEFRKRRKDIKK